MWPWFAPSTALCAAAAWSLAERSALSVDADGLSLAAVDACRPALNRFMSAWTGASPRSIRSLTRFWLDTDQHVLRKRCGDDARHQVADRVGADDEVAHVLLLPPRDLRQEGGARPAGRVAEEQEDGQGGSAQVRQRDALTVEVGQREVRSRRADPQPAVLLERVEPDEDAAVPAQDDGEQHRLREREQAEAGNRCPHRLAEPRGRARPGVASGCDQSRRAAEEQS